MILVLVVFKLVSQFFSALESKMAPQTYAVLFQKGRDCHLCVRHNRRNVALGVFFFSVIAVPSS